VPLLSMRQVDRREPLLLKRRAAFSAVVRPGWQIDEESAHYLWPKRSGRKSELRLMSRSRQVVARGTSERPGPAGTPFENGPADPDIPGAEAGNYCLVRS